MTLDFPTAEITVVNPTTALLVNEFSETVRLVSGDVVEVAGGGSQLWVKRDGRWRLLHVSGATRH